MSKWSGLRSCGYPGCYTSHRSKTGYCQEHRPKAKSKSGARKGSTAEKAARGTRQDSVSTTDASTFVELEDALDKIEALEAQVLTLERQLAVTQATAWSGLPPVIISDRGANSDIRSISAKDWVID